MAPTPQEHVSAQEKAGAGNAGDRIVISGMAGLYPQANNVKELSDILYNKINPITTEALRYKFSHPEVPQYGGSVPQLAHFDAQFFKVHYRLGSSMDPMSRKILEQTYQAIYDAGVNPEQLSGRKVGVYIGSCYSETEKTFFYDAASRTGLGVAGCNKSMFANRISYWLNAKGPSMAIDDACCSSTVALEQACQAIIRGECEAAIVGGAYLSLHPQSSVHYGRIMNLCPDGKTKSFDQNADGCVKSEAINVLFLQKAKDALRIYAEVLYVKTEFIGLLKTNTGPRYGFYRNPTAIANYLKKFYEEADVPPQAVEYVEALGSAVPEVDKAELEALDDVFCHQRDQPLLVGSVISNIGYNEAASGISAVTKVLLGYHTGELAANLHCSVPRRDVAALREGRVRVLTEHQRFGRTYTAVNGMSVTGVNSHVLLHGHYKHKDLSSYKSSIPYLINISARMESSVNNVLDKLKSHPVNPEEIALLHNIHQMTIQGHLGRGFIILETNEKQETVSLCERTTYFDVVKRPLWFVYSGMGSQWAGMGKQLMRIPIFAAAVERCHRVLEPKGIDIVDIITTPDKTIYDNILHSFVGIAAVQIGLTDILTELGLQPDGIIGHSVGELGCAYADGCLSAEEMILAAYCRGLVSLQTPFIRGSMAAVGLGYQQISQMCPPEIEVACHNGPESSTISGPAEAMSQFVAELTVKGIFAKEVPCSNIAYHSRYIADAGPGLLKYLNEVIKTPRPRTERWISSSVPQDKWKEPLAKYSSAEYHTNNLLNPVLFEETSRLIPSNAVLVEVAPHGLLQAILKRSLPPSCANIALTRRAHPDNVYLLLEAIGKLFMEGYNPKIQVLYPKVEFPVSTGTPHLSHLVEWSHGEVWPIPLYSTAQMKTSACCNLIISLHDQESTYLRGNVIRGQTLYPFAAVLVAVWDTLAMSLGVAKRRESVEFRDVHLHAQPPLHDQRPLRLSITLHKGNGEFEVLDGSSKVASGSVKSTKDIVDLQNKTTTELEPSIDDTELTADDIYNLLEERDYSYSGEFRNIVSASSSLESARVRWRGNWAALLDGALQLHALRQAHAGVSTPTHIRKICIDITEHDNYINNAVHTKDTDDNVLMQAKVLEKHDILRCGGISIEHIKYNNLPPVNNSNITLKIKRFISNLQFNVDVSSSLQVFLQIVAENTNKQVLNVVGLTNDEAKGVIFESMRKMLHELSVINIDYEEMTLESASKFGDRLTNTDLVLVQNLSAKESLCHLLYRVLQRDAFVISEEQDNGRNVHMPFYRVVSSHTDGKRRLDLARWHPTPDPVTTTTVSVRTLADIELLKLTYGSLLPNQKLLVVTSYPALPGLKELVRDWRKNANRNEVHLIMTNDIKYHNPGMNNLPNIDLAYNVIENDTWGRECYVPIKELSTKVKNVTLQSSQIGNLDSLCWVETPEPSGDGITVSVHYAGLNYNDVKKASGSLLFKHDVENSYGMDFSGTTKNGDRVMGIVASGSCSSRVRAIPQLLWPVPAHWSLEDAATVPYAYTHVFYCFCIKAHLQPGMTVLIHGGAGAMGQAAISIALALSCQVFTTVSDIRKKHFLKKMFPELKDDHIGNSREESFGDMVLHITKGKGCDFVITTGSGDFKDISIKCCSMYGIMFDTTQLQNHEKYTFGMNNLNFERSYYAVDFSSLFSYENYDDLKALQVMVSEGIARGYVRPLSRVTYEADAAARALRLLAASKHRGRALLRMQHTPHDAQPRLACDPEQCQLMLLDNKSFGLQMADRLVSRGATKLYLHSNIQSTSYLELKKRSWESQGVQVQVSSADLNTEKDVRTLLKNALHLGPVEGIYMIVDDENDTEETLLTSMDLASKQLCPNMKYFAVVNVGNTIGEYTCLSRVHNQLPATILTLPQPIIDDDNMSMNSVWRRSAAEATERALLCRPGAFRAVPARARTTTLLQQIAHLADINILEETSVDSTLEKLGVEEHKLKIISTYLQIHKNIALSGKEIQSLTIEDIRQLDNTEFNTENTKGLASFFSYVDSDELLATTEMAFLSTLIKLSRREDELVASEQYLCIVPGMEGHHARFRTLCERLKLPALVLQPGLDRPHEPPRDLAHRYAQILLTKVEVKNNFYLLGYESGVQVALETASILEERGLTGTVFCVGYMPDEFQTEVEQQLCEYKSEEQLQDAVVRHMFQLMVRADAAELESELQAAATWTQKVDATVRSLLGRVPHSAQYARALIEAALARITQARRCEGPVRGLRSRVVLLRAAASQPLPADALQQYSQQPVVLHQLQASLAQAASDLRCAAIVNQHLHSDIIEKFEKLNICDTYLMNAECYMTPYADKESS